MRVNAFTTGYSARGLEGTGSAVSSFTESGNTSFRFGLNASAATATSNTFGNSVAYIPNYSGSTSKSFSIDAVTENNATQAFQRIYAGLQTSTSAITSISLFSGEAGVNLVEHSTASLYGITKGSDGIFTTS